MNFLYPAFLFGLFALSIPIIIHLFNFRSYKIVYFSNVKFLKDIKQETKSKSTLKHLLVLLMRILAVTSLVFAFSQPYIPAGNTNTDVKDYKVSVYIDNSFSTEADSKYGKISELAKKRALEIADAYPENSKFLFLTNDFEQKHRHYVSKEQLKDFILETKTSPAVKYISKVIDVISDFFTENKEENILYTSYIISDFQKSSSDINILQQDSLLNVVFIPLEAEHTNNMFIDSIWFESPGRPLYQTDELFVKLTNKSDESYTDIPINLYLNDTLKSTGTYNINANESTVEILNFVNEKTGIINGRIEISDFPITYDNSFYFNFDIKEKIKILILSKNKKNKYIDDIFTDIPYVNIEYKSSQNFNINKFNAYDVIILDDIKTISEDMTSELVNYTSDGGKLIIFPGTETNIQSHNKLYNKLGINLITGIDTTKIYAEKINYNASVFKNVFKKEENNLDLPYFLKRVKFSDQTFANEEVILLSEKNDKLISSASYGNGKVFRFSQRADKSSGNLVFHPIWASMIYNMAVFNTIDDYIYFTIGSDELVRVKKLSDGQDNIIHILNENKTADYIPQVSRIENSDIKIFLNNIITKAGHYQVISAEKPIKGLSFNYDRKESDLDHYSFEELKTLIKENALTNYQITDSKEEFLSRSIQENNLGKQLWKFFLISALLFILFEILLIRFLK